MDTSTDANNESKDIVNNLEGQTTEVPPKPPGQPISDFLLQLEEYSPTVSFDLLKKIIK